MKSDYWGADYIVCGNSDILFTPNWSDGLIDALETNDLVGPITNAPGRIFSQNVLRFVKHYKLTDDPNYLSDLSLFLRTKYWGRHMPITFVNGFFLMAKKETWLGGSFSDTHTFDPAEVMNDGAYELQKRWRRTIYRKIAMVPSSFIWHYRSVSRGQKGLLGPYGKGAYRRKKI